MLPLPKYGLVPMFKQITRIVNVQKHPVLGHTYTLHTKDKNGPLTIHYNMSREQIMEQIADYAAFEVGQRVTLERYGEKVVSARRWSFKEGRAYYQVADPRSNTGSGWMPEERLKQMVEDAARGLNDPRSLSAKDLDIVF